MANYLLAGTAGFIGSKIAEKLLQDGHLVKGLDNLNDAYDVRLKHWRLKNLSNYPNFTFHHIDISDKNALDNANLLENEKVVQFDAIINEAARAGVRQSIKNPWGYMETNLTGTLNLLEMCRQMGIPKFILASTSSVYGADAPLPTPEDANSDKPLQVYAASKKAAEVLSYSYHYLYDIDVTVFRYFTVFGPQGRPDMSIFRFIQWISEDMPLHLFGDGEQKRGFTYVDDIADGTILGLKPLGYEVINLGGHEIVTINELIHMLEEIIGKKAKIIQSPAHPADMRANWANVDKARKLLNWTPKVSFQEGLMKAVEWYQAERSWAKTIKTI